MRARFLPAFALLVACGGPPASDGDASPYAGDWSGTALLDGEEVPVQATLTPYATPSHRYGVEWFSSAHRDVMAWGTLRVELDLDLPTPDGRSRTWEGEYGSRLVRGNVLLVANVRPLTQDCYLPVLDPPPAFVDFVIAPDGDALVFTQSMRTSFCAAPDQMVLLP